MLFTSSGIDALAIRQYRMFSILNIFQLQREENDSVEQL